MKFIARNVYWLIICWIIILLLSYKLYNNFIFTNIQAIIFLLFLIIPILNLLICKRYVYLKNKQKWQMHRNDYLVQIETLINKSFINKLKTIVPYYEFNIQNDTLIFGINKLGLLTFTNNCAKLSIIDTEVSYNYYYGKSLEVFTKYDESGFQRRPVEYLFKRILSNIENLVNKELIYYEYVRSGIIVGAELYIDGELKFYVNNRHNKKLIKKNAIKRTIIL